jgi:hypothetical protein
LAGKGIGSIGSPVSAADAKRLIGKASHAPHGRGEETIVDTTARRVWQIEPSQFVLGNAEWNTHVGAIVDAIEREFRIGQKVNAQRKTPFCSISSKLPIVHRALCQ